MNYILMIVFNQIQYDARVIRAAESISSSGLKVKVISINSDINYKNPSFESVVFKSKFKNQFLLISFWIQCLLYIWNERKNIELLYLHDYYMPIIGGIYKFITKKKWVYDSHELLFYHQREKHSARNTFFLILECMSIKSASLVIAANEERRKFMRIIYGLKNSIYVLNVANMSKKSLLSSAYKENVIVYQGALSEERKVDFFIENHTHIASKYRLKLIGSGPMYQKYKRRVDEIGYKNVCFIGQVNQERLYNESKTSKIGLISYPLNTLNNYYCSPNKIFEYAKMRIPMIVTKQPFLVKIVEKYHIGIAIDTLNGYEDYINAVKEIDSNYSSYIERMDDFLNDYSAEKELEKLKRAIKDLVYHG